ncbi:MAG TPA: TolC family protein, partial [Elusimicrobiota bacterium]|nr:TolC family protein [Elusimicrobiota bacterium]
KLLSNTFYQQLLAQANDPALSEEVRRQATTAMGVLSSFSTQGKIEGDQYKIDLSGRQRESMDLNEFLLLQDFILNLPSFQRLVDPRAADIFKGKNALELFEISGDPDADPFLRSEAQRIIGLAAFMAGMSTSVVDSDGDGVPDDVVIRLVQDGEARTFALSEDTRVTEMLMKDFMDAFATVLNLEEFQRLLNEGGDFTFTDRNGHKIQVPANAILASTFFGNYGAITDQTLFDLFGVNRLRVDRDGDGVLDDTPLTRFDLLTLNDPRVQAVNSIVVFLSLNRAMLEKETGLTINQIVQKVAQIQPLFREYVQTTAFDRDVKLTEGDFMFLLYLLREAQARHTTLEEMLVEPRFRAEMTVRYQLFDSETMTQKNALRWGNKQAEILYEVEHAQQSLKLVEHFYDIRTAQENIALATAHLQELQRLREEASVRKIPSQVEHSRLLGRLDQQISETRQALTKAQDALRDATYAVKRMLRWPADKPVQFELGDEELARILREAGADRLAALRRQAAEAKIEQYRAAVPERYRSQASIGGVLDILRAVGVKALGPLYAVNFVMSVGVFDKQRGPLRDAAVFAYARAIVEAEELKREQAAENEKASFSLADLDRRIASAEEALFEMEERIADVQRAVDRDEAPMADLAELYKNRFEARRQLEALRRERTRMAKKLVEYEGPYVPVQPPKVGTGEKIVNGAVSVVRAAMNPFDLLLSPFRKGKDKARLEALKQEIVRQDAPPVALRDAGVDQLFELARARNPLFRQAQAYEREREMVLKAQKAGAWPKINTVLRYSSSVDPGGLRPQSFGDLFTSGQLSYGLNATWRVYDPSRGSRVLIEQMEVEKADLGANDIASQVYLTIAWQLETLERLQDSLPRLQGELNNVNDRLAQARQDQEFNIFSDPELARLEYEKARLEDEVKVARARIQTLKIEIKKTAGLTDADSLEFSDTYSIRDLHHRLALQRFDRYVQETEGRVEMNAEGKKVVDGVADTVDDARQYLALLQARQFLAVARSADKRSPALAGMEERLRGMEAAVASRDLSLKDKTAQLNALLGEIRGLVKDIPALAKDSNSLLLGELSAKLAELEAALADPSADPLTRLARLSEYSVYLTAVTASLTPELKWKTREGAALGLLLTAWDKALMGRFDPFVSQRIAIRTAEIYQLQAMVANKMEPIELNMDFLTLFSTGDKKTTGTSVGSYFRQNALNFVSIPPKLIETVFSPMHKAFHASRIGRIPVIGALLRDFIPGLKSSEARKAAIEEYMALALRELSSAQQKGVELQNARSAAIAHYRASVELLNLTRTRKVEFAMLSPYATLEEQKDASNQENVRLKYERDAQRAQEEVGEAELALLALGITPESLPPVAAPAGPALPLSLSAGRQYARDTFNVRMAELNKRIEAARLKKAEASSTLGRFQLMAGGQSAGWKFLPFFRFQLFSRESSTPYAVEAQRAEYRAAEQAVESEVLTQAGKLQDYYARLVESRLKAQLYDMLAGGSLAEAEQLAGLSSREIDALTARVQRDIFRSEAARARADFSTEAELLSALSVTSRSLLLQALPSPQALTDALRALQDATMNRPVDVSAHPEVRRAQEMVRAEQLRRMDVALKAFIPDINLDFQQNDFNNVLEVHLNASWRIIGSGTAARKGMADAEIAALQEKERQIRYDIESRIAQNREEMSETLFELARVDGELKDLCDSARMQKLMSDYREGRIQIGELTAHLSSIGRLMGERAYQLVRLAGLYESISQVFGAHGAPLPPLSELLKVSPEAASMDNLLKELGRKAPETPTEQPVVLPAEWGASRSRTVPKGERPANVAPVPLWTVSKITTVGTRESPEESPSPIDVPPVPGTDDDDQP